MTNFIKITVQGIINAPVDKVWEFYTLPEHITKWNFASDDWWCPKSTNDLQTGGKFSSRMEAKDGSMGFDFSGFYTEIETNKLIKYTMADPDTDLAEQMRDVKISFEKLAENQTKLIIIFDAETENSAEMQQKSWQSILDNFIKYTELNQ